jgi:hypothetical protein
MEAQARQTLNEPTPGVRLGPAQVRGVMDGALLIDLDGDLARATMALAYPYRPAVGDTVLVMGQDDRWYVTGVLDGKGLTRMDFPGDLELRAAGRVRIESQSECTIDAPRLVMRGDRLEMAITAIRQQAASLYQQVSGTLRTIAGRQHTTVEKQSTLHARKIVRKAEDDVIVDGRQIKLG